MKEENKKEILKKEDIEKDVAREYKKEIATYLYATIGFFVFWCISLTLVEFKLEFKNVFCNAISIVVFIGTGVLFFFTLKSIRNYRRNEYLIVVGEYIGLAKKLIGNDMHYCLNFLKYGKFRLDYMAEYYSLSQYYKMDMHKLIETSSIGDSFYLIIVNKKIIYAYNMKFFEIKSIF